MASFDMVSKVDIQTLDNAINTAKKEIATRYDLKDSKTSVELDKKSPALQIITANDMALKSVIRIVIDRVVKQGLDPLCLDLSKAEYASGTLLRKDIPIKEGIDKETAKKIVKEIKDSGLKVQAAIMDAQIRVTAKKIDDLQAVIALMRQKEWGVALQFINMKRD